MSMLLCRPWKSVFCSILHDEMGRLSHLHRSRSRCHETGSCLMFDDGVVGPEVEAWEQPQGRKTKKGGKRHSIKAAASLVHHGSLDRVEYLVRLVPGILVQVATTGGIVVGLRLLIRWAARKVSLSRRCRQALFVLSPRPGSQPSGYNVDRYKNANNVGWW